MLSRPALACTVFASSVLLAGWQAAAAADDRLPERGLNLSHWFSQVQAPGGATREHLTGFVTDADLARIAGLGFDHVRFPVEVELFMDRDDPARLDAEHLALLDAAVERILDHGLDVIVDAHPSQGFKKWLAESPEHVDRFAAFWEVFARHLSKYDAGRLYLELLNEPATIGGDAWDAVWPKLAAAARRGAPEHTLIASGGMWSGSFELLKVEPIEDPNVIYNFHFYTPMTFTHQGASWSQPQWGKIAGMPYPSSPELVRGIEPLEDDEAAVEAIRAHGEERWGRGALAERISAVADWAERHGVRVTCNEFGVYSKFAPDADRLRWLSDVVGLLEAEGMGWTMWDYSGAFGIFDIRSEPRRVNEGVIEALGLREGAGVR